MKNNQRNHIGMFLYLIQVKTGLFTVISVAGFLGPPLSILHVVATVSNSIRENTGVRRIDLAMTKRSTRDIFPLVDG